MHSFFNYFYYLLFFYDYIASDQELVYSKTIEYQTITTTAKPKKPKRVTAATLSRLHPVLEARNSVNQRAVSRQIEQLKAMASAARDTQYFWDLANVLRANLPSDDGGNEERHFVFPRKLYLSKDLPVFNHEESGAAGGSSSSSNEASGTTAVQHGLSSMLLSSEQSKVGTIATSAFIDISFRKVMERASENKTKLKNKANKLAAAAEVEKPADKPPEETGHQEHVRKRGPPAYYGYDDEDVFNHATTSQSKRHKPSSSKHRSSSPSGPINSDEKILQGTLIMSFSVVDY